MHYRFTQTSIWRACRWKSIINCNLDCLTPSMDHTARHSFGWMLMLQCRLSISSSNASQLAFWSAIQNYATCATALHTLSQTFLPASRVCIMIGKRESERERIALSVNRSESWVRWKRSWMAAAQFSACAYTNFIYFLSLVLRRRAAEACKTASFLIHRLSF